MLAAFSRRAACAALVVAALSCPVYAAGGPSATITTDDIMNMLTNMGYSPSMNGKSVEVKVNRDGDHYIYFDLSKDSTIIYADISFQTYTEAESKKLDIKGLLVANDSNRAYYSLEEKDGKYSLYLNVNAPSSGANASTLRGMIDSILNTESDTDSLWNIWEDNSSKSGK